MKRIICLILVLMCILPGCGHKEEAAFFYRRAEFQYGSEDSVIISEIRDITGNTTNLPFLISLYLLGPVDKDLISPFPADVKLLYVSLKDSNLTVSLTANHTMSESEFILASTCMALTCMEITDVDSVTVTSAERTVTIDSALLTMYDSNIPTENTSGGQE